METRTSDLAGRKYQLARPFYMLLLIWDHRDEVPGVYKTLYRC